MVASLLVTHAEVHPAGAGLWGFSQGGWIVPLAAAILRDFVAFTVIGSGPTVSLGEELLHRALTGDPDCVPSGLSAAEIERRLDSAGPSGFDPRASLETMTAPGCGSTEPSTRACRWRAACVFWKTCATGWPRISRPSCCRD